MGQIIDGKQIAASVRAKIAQEVAKMQNKPGLAVVIVGNDPASEIYVRNKNRFAEEVGMFSEVHALSATTTEAELLQKVEELNKNPKISGFLVQMPLPKTINPDTIIAAIDPQKDVDGFHPLNVGKLFSSSECPLAPCTPRGCVFLIKSALGENLSGKKALVIGRSNIVGKPLAKMLLDENMTVTIAHSRTQNLQEESLAADVLVAAIGKPEMIKGEWIKKGAVVIDVGTSRVDDKLVGDVEFAKALERASFITPVPGGVGPMTIALLLANTLSASRIQQGLSPFSL